MNIQLISETKEGRWAALLTLLFIVMMTFRVFIRFPLPTPAIALFGVAGAVLGILSVTKNRDRTIFTWLSLLVGLVIIVWTAAELAFPH